MFKETFDNQAMFGDSISCEVGGITYVCRIRSDYNTDIETDDNHRITDCMVDAEREFLTHQINRFEFGDWCYCSLVIESSIHCNSGFMEILNPAEIKSGIPLNYIPTGPFPSNRALTEIANSMLDSAIEVTECRLIDIRNSLKKIGL